MARDPGGYGRDGPPPTQRGCSPGAAADDLATRSLNEQRAGDRLRSRRHDIAATEKQVLDEGRRQQDESHQSEHPAKPMPHIMLPMPSSCRVLLSLQSN